MSNNSGYSKEEDPTVQLAQEVIKVFLKRISYITPVYEAFIKASSEEARINLARKFIFITALADRYYNKEIKEISAKYAGVCKTSIEDFIDSEKTKIFNKRLK